MQQKSAQSIAQFTNVADHVAANGSDSAPYFHAIAEDLSILSGADIADLAHFLCVLHGRHPGVIDHASTKTADCAARQWFMEAVDGFTAERAFLTKLTVAAGPISGISANDESDAVVLGQRKALEMLSQSDRDGCAVGAAFALILDWHAVRPVLEKIGIRVGVEPRQSMLPSHDSTQQLHDVLTQSATVERAVNFGSDQLLSQHRGLWQLLEARRNARTDV